MTLTAAPSGISENIETTTLSKEAQARVNTVATSAIDLLDKNPDAQSAIADLFSKMVSENLRDPGNIGEIQKGLYESRDSRLAAASPSERLSILESFSTFMAKFTQWIAQMNRDIGLSNEANTLANTSDAKIKQVQATYAQILANNHPTQTA